MAIKSYLEMVKFPTIQERYEYLKIPNAVGKATFGSDRYLNQIFYKSMEWKRVRDQVIIRDDGCDLGVPGYTIHDKILIHHINPMTPEDIRRCSLAIIDPNFLVCTSRLTHQAIHFGDASLLPEDLVVRSPGDTKLW